MGGGGWQPLLFKKRKSGLGGQLCCPKSGKQQSQESNISQSHPKPSPLSDAMLPWRSWDRQKASHFVFYLYTESVVTIVIPLSSVWTLPNQAHRRSWWDVSTGSPTTRLLTEDRRQRKMNSTQHAERVFVLLSHKEVPF